jgi:hypothetical protein
MTLADPGRVHAEAVVPYPAPRARPLRQARR